MPPETNAIRCASGAMENAETFEMPLGSGIECTRFWASTSLSWPLTATHDRTGGLGHELRTAHGAARQPLDLDEVGRRLAARTPDPQRVAVAVDADQRRRRRRAVDGGSDTPAFFGLLRTRG